MIHFTGKARMVAAAAAAVGALAGAPAIAMASTGAPARPAAVSVPACETPGLVIWLDTNGNSALGTTFFKLHLTNLTSHACTLNGFPFLYAVNLAGKQVGRRATFAKPPSPSTITLKPGKTATAALGIVDTGNFPTASCRPVTAAGLRVFPPNQTRAKLVPFPFSTCSRRSGPASLTIGAVTK